MEQPEHLSLRPFQVAHSNPRRFVSLGAVALFHVAVIWAFASGLANHLYQKTEQELKVAVVKEHIDTKPPPPPPPPDLAKPPPPFVPPPVISIQSEAPAPIAAVTHTITPPAPAPVAPKPAEVIQPALVSGGAKCETSYYPSIAVRLNQEGTVTVAVHIAADGSVSSVDVANSSGHDSLDEASIKCVTNAWHFKPATKDGVAVPATKEYRIKWVLQG
jgi:protein TonB